MLDLVRSLTGIFTFAKDMEIGQLNLLSTKRDILVTQNYVSLELNALKLYKIYAKFNANLCKICGKFNPKLFKIGGDCVDIM